MIKFRNGQILFAIILGVFLICSGCNRETKPNSLLLSIEKNNQSAEFFFNRFQDEINVEYAFELVYEAIKLDSLNADAYSNLAMYYNWQDKTEKSIQVLDVAIDKIDSPETASLYFSKGLYLFTLEGITDETQLAFEMARNRYNEIIDQGNRPEKVDLIRSEIAFTYLFTDSLDRAIREIQEVITAYPDSELAKGYKVIINNFFSDFESSP
ncbi:MAG: hypothetical protein LAT67_01880 [Balneolales bacterium]|nr:hypothetical protein [Balneolales bacterium]